MDDLLGLSACEMSGRIEAGAMRATDLMRATLERIDAVNGAVNAVVSLRDREALMAEARVAETAPRQGWLHGIPMAIKDLVDVKGVRCSHGSPLFADFVPQADDPMVTRLRRAGAIIIGKTNVPEMGLGSHSFNPVFGVTRNPYDLTRSAGGSSGGAGAALACGMLAVADGSDAMGSLRNPSAWNNVYGFRPTVGLLPEAAGEAVAQHFLSTRGPMARDMGDLGPLLHTLSDGAFSAPQAPRRPLRIGWLGDWGGAWAMEPGLIDLAEDALAVFEGLGWAVEPVAPPMTAAALWDSWTTLRSFYVAQGQGADYADPARRAMMKPELLWEVERGLAFTGADVWRATAIRQEWLAALDTLFSRFDALVLPSTQVWPFPAEWRWPRQIGATTMDTYHRWMESVVPVSLAGLPCLNLPAGFGADGLPGGVQVFARRGADARLLGLGQAYHEVTTWPARRRPPL